MPVFAVPQPFLIARKESSFHGNGSAHGQDVDFVLVPSQVLLFIH